MRIVTTKRQSSRPADRRTPGAAGEKTKASRRVRRDAIHSGDYRTKSRVTQTLRRLVVSGVLAVLLCALVCCSTPRRATVPTGDSGDAPSEVIARGDWADADAVVRTAVRRTQMAIESRREYRSALDTETTVLVFTVRTVRGDSGELTLKRLGDEEILVRCRIGALGSRDAESALVGEIVDRLATLRGRDYAPLDG